MNSEKTDADALKEARERLKKAKDKIDKQVTNSNLTEPENLRSGHLDELAILRHEKENNDAQ